MDLPILEDLSGRVSSGCHWVSVVQWVTTCKTVSLWRLPLCKTHFPRRQSWWCSSGVLPSDEGLVLPSGLHVFFIIPFPKLWVLSLSVCAVLFIFLHSCYCFTIPCFNCKSCWVFLRKAGYKLILLNSGGYLIHE